MRRTRLLAPLLAMCLVGSGLAGSEASRPVLIEGSSTVYPISVAAGERIAQDNPQLVSEVVCSGSSAGLRRLIAGEIPVADASRPINKEEIAIAAAHGIDYIELPIALDAITFVVNPKNSFVTSLTVDELRRLWQPDSKITTWSQLRQGWPDAPIELFGMGKDSGTFDFMTEAIVGKARAIRSDLAGTSQDPQQLIQSIVSHEQGIGYFGHAYFKQNAAMLRAVPVDDGRGPVMPSTESIVNRTYRPLSRPIFIYVNRAEADHRPEVAAFVTAYLRLASQVVPQVGYVPLSERSYELVRQRFASRVIGSAFSAAHPEDRLDDLLAMGLPKSAAPAAKPAIAPAAAAPAAVSAATTASAPVQAPVAAAQAPAVAQAPVATAQPAPAPATASSNPWLPATTRAPSTAATAGADDVQQAVDRLRSESLELARLALDDASPISELERREQELRAALQRVSAGVKDTPMTAGRQATLADATSLGSQAQLGGGAYASLIGRIELTDAAHGLIDVQTLGGFKQAALALGDPDLRRRLVLALRNPSSANVPQFAEVVAGLGQGRGDAAIILCYARGGLVVR